MAAIYMWPEDKYLLLTTTLYPIDVTDVLVFGVSVTEGALDLLPNSDFKSTFGLEDSTLIQLRWFYTDGPYDSDFLSTFDLQDGTLIQLRWFLTDGPYDSYFLSTFDLQDGSLINKLVAVDTPDEKIQLALKIEASSTMDLI